MTQHETVKICKCKKPDNTILIQLARANARRELQKDILRLLHAHKMSWFAQSLIHTGFWDTKISVIDQLTAEIESIKHE